MNIHKGTPPELSEQELERWLASLVNQQKSNSTPSSVRQSGDNRGQGRDNGHEVISSILAPSDHSDKGTSKRKPSKSMLHSFRAPSATIASPSVWSSSHATSALPVPASRDYQLRRSRSGSNLFELKHSPTGDSDGRARFASSSSASLSHSFSSSSSSPSLLPFSTPSSPQIASHHDSGDVSKQAQGASAAVRINFNDLASNCCALFCFCFSHEFPVVPS